MVFNVFGVFSFDKKMFVALHLEDVFVNKIYILFIWLGDGCFENDQRFLSVRSIK